MYSLIRLAQNGDKTARDMAVEQNLGLVKSIARRFLGRGTDYEDLCQIGSIGLLKAVDRFDVASGYSFSTYAVPLITGEIKRFLRDDGMIKVSRSLKELGAKAYAVRERLERDGHEATISEIAKELGVKASELAPALDAVRDVVSLNTSDDEGRERMEFVVQPYSDTDSRIFIGDILNTLEERDRKLVIMRYFAGKTQIETAGLLGISQVQVSRCEKKILQKLREYAVM